MKRVAAALAAFALAALALGTPTTPREAARSGSPPRPARPRATATNTPGPTRLSRARLNRQDRVDRARRRRETDAFDGRPLLGQLPLTLAGVTIDIAGLAPNGRSTLLTIDAGERSHAHARAIYEQALRTYGDPGRAYQPRYTP